MNSFLRHFAISAVSLAIMGGCAATVDSTVVTTTVIPTQITVALATPVQAEEALTLKQIMANPDWMGILAQGAYWSDDSQSVYFSRQAHQSPVRDYYQQSITATTANLLELSQLHLADQRNGVIN